MGLGSKTDRDWCESFLASGVLLAWDDDRFLVGWGEPRWTEGPDAERHSFYAPDFYLESPAPWLVPSLSTIMTRSELITRLEEWLAEREISKSTWNLWEWTEPCFDAFGASFHSIRAGMERGELDKAVPVAFESARGRVTPVVAGSFLRKLLAVDTPSRLYGLWSEGGGILGLTPELLFSIRREKLTSMALAGTRRRESVPAEWDDPKEIHEHELVVSDLQGVLSRFGPVRRGAREIVSLGALEHFRTPIEVDIGSGVEFTRIAEAMHPTAALGVYPRTFGWRSLKQWDPSGSRGRFGAPFGARAPDGSGLCVVAIRNVQWRDERISIGSGCGIVRGSSLEREWAELALKRGAVKGWLGL